MIYRPSLEILEPITTEELSESFHKLFHDIGNPITSIISYGSLIEQSSKLNIPIDKVESYAHSISQESWKVNRLLELFLLLVSEKIQSNAVSLEVVKKQVLTRYQSRYGLGAIDLYLEGFESAPQVRADQEQLTVIICEIITNALGAFKALAELEPNYDGECALRCEVLSNNESNFVTLKFTNSCPAHKNELVSLFKLGHSEYSKNTQAPGIGLRTIARTLNRWNASLEIGEEITDQSVNEFITLVHLEKIN